jgi:hypothetical protein
MRGEGRSVRVRRDAFERHKERKHPMIECPECAARGKHVLIEQSELSAHKGTAHASSIEMTLGAPPAGESPRVIERRVRGRKAPEMARERVSRCDHCGQPASPETMQRTADRSDTPISMTSTLPFQIELARASGR